MASVNKFIGVGNIGRDPETRHMPSGDAMVTFSIACTEKWKDKSGQPQEHTEWVRVAMFGKLAEIAGQYLKKGSQVYIEGKLRTRKWDKDGVDHYTTEIIADHMQMLGGRPDNRHDSDEEYTPPATDRNNTRSPQKGNEFFDQDSDIPF